MKKSAASILVILLCLSLSANFLIRREKISTETLIDTIVIRDTIRDTVLIPQKVYIARTDTVFFQIPADTVKVPVLVPIERKEYGGENYHAVVEGYRPSLAEISVFPETRYITRTEVKTVKTRPRFGFGIQAGYGINGRGHSPYVGLGVQYNFVTW